MIDLPSISAIVVAVSVVVGLLFTMMELRHMAQTRRTEIILHVYERFGSKEMVEAMNSVGRLRLEKSEAILPREQLTKVMQVAVALEGLGVLLDQKLIDIGLLDSLFGPTLDTLWEPLKPLVYGMRSQLKQPYFFSHFEMLHGRLEEQRLKKPKSWSLRPRRGVLAGSVRDRTYEARGPFIIADCRCDGQWPLL
jgi:hypothetical protein